MRTFLPQEQILTPCINLSCPKSKHRVVIHIQILYVILRLGERYPLTFHSSSIWPCWFRFKLTDWTVRQVLAKWSSCSNWWTWHPSWKFEHFFPTGVQCWTVVLFVSFLGNFTPGQGFNSGARPMGQRVPKGRSAKLTLKCHSSFTRNGKSIAWRILFSLSVCSTCFNFTTYKQKWLSRFDQIDYARMRGGGEG